VFKQESIMLRYNLIIVLIINFVSSKQIPNKKLDQKPVYTNSKNDVEESHAYSSLLAGLQKTPIVPNTYSGLPLNTNAVLYSSLYTSTIGAPGYPASTWPLSRAPIVKNVGVTPYINGLFGFGALKNKVIPQKSGCPNGYAEMHGDIPGWGSSLGSKLYLTRDKCAEECDRFSDCLSFEHSNSEFLCNLNVLEEPTARKYKDYVFCSKRNKLDDKGNIVQPITRPIVPSGGVLKDINNKIEKLQHDSKQRFDESKVWTNLTICYYTGDDILKSHLMFNDRWWFDRYNLEGLKTYINDLTFGANVLLGRDNYSLRWRGPFKRSDADKRYPGNMEKDTKRAQANLGNCDAVVFLVFNNFVAQNATDGHQFSGFVKGAPCEAHRGSGYIVMVDQGFWKTEWTGAQILSHQLLRLLTADVCDGTCSECRHPYADIKAKNTIHWNTNCFCKNEDSLLHPYIKPGEQYLDNCVIKKLNKSDISLRECLLPDHDPRF